MIKFNYLIFLLLLNFTLISANNKSNSDPDITIELLNVTTNGQILPNNTINFNGVDDLVLEFDLRTSYTGTVAKYCEGTSYAAFYEPNEFDNETAQHYNNGVEPIQLIWYPIKLEHINNNHYSYTYRKKLLFKKSTVYSTGCSIVFTYGPTKLTYKIIGGTKTGKEPYSPSVANIKLTSLSYSDGSPIINNKIIVPDYVGNEIGTQSINLSFDFDVKYGSQFSQGYYPSYIIQIRHDEGYSTSLIPLFEKIISTDKGTVTIKNLVIKSSDLRPNDHLRILFNFQEARVNLDWALIKGNNEKPILNNIISDNQTIAYGQICKPFTTPSAPYIDYSIICDRNVRTCQTLYDYRYITSFQWQTRTQGTNWTNISGATAKDYSPNKPFTENTYYRRLAYFGNEQYSISNTTAVIIQDTSISNNICCDQSLQFKNSQPQPINGSAINTDSYTYQWQYSKNFRRNEFLPWNDILGATNQNYNHNFTEDAITNDEKTQFRRIIKLNSLPINISNSVVVSRYSVLDYTPTPSRRSSLQSQSSNNLDLTNLNEFDINNLSIYPNPASDILSIDGPVNIELIKLYDSYGTKLDINKHQKSANLIEVNTSKLQPGVYILKIDNTTYSKTILKN
ncbi:MAG: T9SS type A sorting domain-containing protein [Flavobacterium sp.]|uniref:T9SS type A sorting domain-containing protein n=1 Tax=Flavobacterium sp. TaxID=239 RepID=UPI001AFE626D|nr:T9SS type A sorting domain-containing protein [Flavobacterium sp.]MBO9584093.1 T9SS type A sorting domain-containing protein [Flavobacterium sp.]